MYSPALHYLLCLGSKKWVNIRKKIVIISLSEVQLGKTIPYLVKKLAGVYRRFITVYSVIHTPHSFLRSIIVCSSHVGLGPSSCVFPWDFPINILYTCLILPICVYDRPKFDDTCRVLWRVQIVKHILVSFPIVCCLLSFVVTIVSFPDTDSACSSLAVRDQLGDKLR